MDDLRQLSQAIEATHKNDDKKLPHQKPPIRKGVNDTQLHGYRQWKKSIPNAINTDCEKKWSPQNKKSSTINRLIQPGALALDAKTQERNEMEKRMVADNYIKFITSDRSVYHKWYILYCYGKEQERFQRPNPFKLEKKFAEENAASLWASLRSIYARKLAPPKTKQLLKYIVKHLNIPYFTDKLEEMEALRTKVEFNDNVNIVEYDMDKEEREKKISDGKSLREAHNQYTKQISEWVEINTRKAILAAYLKYLKENEPELHKMYTDQLAAMDAKINAAQSWLPKEDVFNLSGGPLSIVKATREKKAFEATLLRRLFSGYPEGMPEKFKPVIIDTDEKKASQQKKHPMKSSRSSDAAKRLKPEGIFDGTELNTQCVIFSDSDDSDSDEF